MKKRRRSGLLKVMLAFFVGVIVTVYFLVPGKVGPTVLVSGDRQLQARQLDQAGQKIERAGAATVLYALRAKDYLRGQLGK